MSISSILDKAKEDNEILFFENFQKPEISWEEVLNFIAHQSSIPNEHLGRIALETHGNNSHGNIAILATLWLAPQNPNLFNIFSGLNELFEKINGTQNSSDCDYYKNEVPGTSHYYHCNCDNTWHMQGIRVSLGDRVVPAHNDPNRVVYWQVLGTSYWKMNGDKVYTLNPGDLLYFNQQDSHEVSQNGPRAGFIIDAIKER